VRYSCTHGDCADLILFSVTQTRVDGLLGSTCGVAFYSSEGSRFLAGAYGRALSAEERTGKE
jgi:hypothetical protein